MKTVGDLLRNKKESDLVTVGPRESVRRAARLMADKKVGMVVVTAHDHVMGIFTERDLLSRVISRERDLDIAVDTVMTSPCIVCTPADDIEEVKTLMREEGFRHAPVADEGSLVGVVTVLDILHQEHRESREAIKKFEEYFCGPAFGG